MGPILPLDAWGAPGGSTANLIGSRRAKEIFVADVERKKRICGIFPQAGSSKIHDCKGKRQGHPECGTEIFMLVISTQWRFLRWREGQGGGTVFCWKGDSR